MKKGVLILLGMFIMVSTTEAKNSNNFPDRLGFNYSYDNSVNFIERGIEFFIFTNGEFDFNTDFNNTYYDYNGRRTRRDVGVRIDRDFRGRIRRVGNAFINYDRFGNVTRVGSIFIRYRRGRLANVGNLRVHYNSWGNPVFYGNVRNNFHMYNGVRFNLNVGDVCDYNDAYFFRNDFRRNYSQIREDRNFYYYKANKNAKIGKRSQILRRRKPASKITKRRTTANTRNRVSSYRKPATSNNIVKRKITTKKRQSNSNSYRKSNTLKRNIDNFTKRKVELKTKKQDTYRKSTITKGDKKTKKRSLIKERKRRN